MVSGFAPRLRLQEGNRVAMPFSRRDWLRGALASSGFALGGCISPTSARATDEKPETIARVGSLHVRTVWSDGRHNGFPGIARFGEHYYVAFRNAASHQATEDTRILVVRSRADDLAKWEQVAEFRNDHDARDPLLFMAGDRLRVVWHSKEDWTSDTADGVSWSKQQLLDVEFVEPSTESGLRLKSQRRWLFRIRRGPDGAYYSLGRCGIKEDGRPGPFGRLR